MHRNLFPAMSSLDQKPMRYSLAPLRQWSVIRIDVCSAVPLCLMQIIFWLSAPSRIQLAFSVIDYAARFVRSIILEWISAVDVDSIYWPIACSSSASHLAAQIATHGRSTLPSYGTSLRSVTHTRGDPLTLYAPCD